MLTVDPFCLVPVFFALSHYILLAYLSALCLSLFLLPPSFYPRRGVQLLQGHHISFDLPWKIEPPLDLSSFRVFDQF